jgi:hypothetical protein
MLRPLAICLLPLFFLAAESAHSQQPATGALPPLTPRWTLSPGDLAKIEAGINAAYYHPDDLSRLDCQATIGWAEVAKQLQQAAPEDRLKALDGMRAEIRAERGKEAEINISWQSGTPTNSMTLENSTRQMLTGFFQMYWSLFASSMGPMQKDIVQAETREGGGYTLHYSSAGTNVTEEIGADLVPTKVSTNSPVLKAEIRPHFSASANPVAGDLRRLTSLDFSGGVGTTVTNYRMEVDYETVESFHIPQRISVHLEGAYGIPIELIGCAVTKQVNVLPPER